MRVTSVSLYSNDVEVVNFALRSETSDSRYMAKQIVGMDAVEITPKFYGNGQDGVPFYDFAMPPRDLVIRVVLNPTFALNEEHSTLRDELYRAISSERSGVASVRFFSGGGVIAKLYGFVTKIEAGYFNKTPEAQITIRCKDPMFRGMNPMEVEEADLGYNNPILVADSISTAPHGFSFDAEITSQIDTLTIKDPNDNWSFMCTPNVPFAVGDIINFSSDYSNKKMCVQRLGGDLEHLMNAIHANSIWPTVFPGRNEFDIDPIGNLQWLKFTHTAAFWGV